MPRAARCLTTLLAQVNAAAPDRSKASDGGIADARHVAAGTSDHIADARGVFHARDFTHDPRGGFDAHACADRLLAAQDHRLKYLISRGRIGSGPTGPSPGRWRPYSGANRHDKHVHVSVVADPALADDTDLWAGVQPAPARLLTHEEDDDMTPDQERLLREVHTQLLGPDPKKPGWPQLLGLTVVDALGVVLADSRAARDQLMGVDPKKPGWSQLGGRTLVDAVGALLNRK